MPTPPLRLAVRAESLLPQTERRGLAAILLRTGLDFDITNEQEAEVTLSLQSRAEPRVVVVEPGVLRTAVATLNGDAEATAARDDHGRPAPPKRGLPLSVDDVAQKLRGEILALAPERSSAEIPWRFCLTFDIDSAGMFFGTNAWHSFRQTSKTPAKLMEFLNAGFSTASGAAPDPHLPFDFLLAFLRAEQIPATFFVQTHREHKLDSYDLRGAKKLQKAMKLAMELGHPLGLHSSYATRDLGGDFFAEQWDRLRSVFGDGVAPVHRAHYLRTPDDLSLYASAGPLIDSSLMFSKDAGFRRGTSFPFRINENLVELPPCVMDTTLRYQMNLSPGQALAESVALMEEVRRIGGVFTPVWHPHNLNNLTWAGWAEVLFGIIAEAKRSGAQFVTVADASGDLQTRADEIEKALEMKAS